MMSCCTSRFALVASHYQVTRTFVDTDGHCNTCELPLASLEIAEDAQQKLVEQFEVRSHAMNEVN